MEHRLRKKLKITHFKTNIMKNLSPKKIALFLGAAALIILLALFGNNYRSLFLGSITSVAPSNTASSLYIPDDYKGLPGDTGAIEIRAGQAIAGVYGLSFTLQYNPQQISFPGNPVTLGAPLNGFFTTVSATTPGQLRILVVGSTAQAIAQGATLMSINLQIAGSVAFGTDITLTPQNVQLSVAAGTLATPATADLTPVVNTAINQISAGKITLQSDGQLKALYAEATDATHITVHFSDFLRNIRTTNINAVTYPIAPRLVPQGAELGRDQRSIILTTDPQTPGQFYTLELPADVATGNTDGTLNAAFDTVPFVGFGAAVPGALSDFAITQATAINYNTVELTFSQALLPGSVYRNAFTLNDVTNPGTPQPITISTASITGTDKVQLNVDRGLLKRNTYLISVRNPGGGNAPRRQRDNATLGIGSIVFTGYKNGPRLTGALVIRGVTPPEVRITLDEPIQVSNNLGDITPTNQTTPLGTLGSMSLSDDRRTIVFVDFTNDPNQNFTFVGGLIQNDQGVALDQAYSAITFWGLDHDNTQNQVGSLTVLNQTTLELQDQNFGFTPDTTVSLFTYDTAGNIARIPTRIVSNENRRLRLTTTAIALPGNQAFILYITKPDNDPSTADPTAVVPFTIEYGLELQEATTVSPNQVRLTFNQNVDQNTTTNPRNFTVYLGVNPQTPQTVEIPNQNFRNVLLTMAPGVIFSPGQLHTVHVTNLRSFNGGQLLSKNAAVFTGYQTTGGMSSVQVESVEPLSATQVRLRFSDNVDTSTLTPVNIALHNDTTLATLLTGTPAAPALSIRSITVENNRSVVLTTARQDNRKNYFVVLSNVRDAAGLLIGNARILNFIGFEVPAPRVTNVSPDNLANDREQTLTLRGTNLTRIATVRLGTTEVRITNPTDQQLTVTIPAGLTAGIHNLNVIDLEGNNTTLSGAVLVSAPQQVLRIVSEESRTIPPRVPNDGQTRVTIWVLVEDPNNIDNVERVSIDLTPIGGAPAQVMTASPVNRTDRRQWFTFTTTLPTSVATRTEPYTLRVTAKNRSQAAEVTGTATVVVTRDVNQSIPPVVNQAYATPISVPPDDKTTAKISARITDPDGIDTINSVVADLSQVGGGFLTLNPSTGPSTGASTGPSTGAPLNTITSGIFTSEPFTVPSTTPVGSYKIRLTVTDNSNATVSQDIDINVSSTPSGPTIDAGQSYIGPRTSVPKNGTTSFSVHVFVSDPDTLADIVSVIVNLRGLGGSPTALTRDATSPETARSGWFSSGDLTVASSTPLGMQNLEVIVTDKSGARSSTILQLEVTDTDTSGSAPRVRSQKNYTTPTVAVNDGITKITLYAFVSDDDDNITSVIAKLGNIGRVGEVAPQTLPRTEGATPAAEASASAPVQTNSNASQNLASPSSTGSCPTRGNILCMTPSVKEGTDGQWYILPDVIINSTTAASTQPYSVEVIVTDATGQTGRGTIPVSVNNGVKYTNDSNPPEIILAVPTSSNTIEVLFSEELDATTVSPTGQEFTVTDRNDIQQTLNIISATINATGTIVTLTTDAQDPGKYYMLSASDKITDALGVKLVKGGTNRVSVVGFTPKNQAPFIEYIATTDASTIEMEFRNDLRPSSLLLTQNKPEVGVEQDHLRPHPRGKQDLNVEVYESGTSKRVSVESVQFGEGANNLIVTTAPLVSGKRYLVSVKNIMASDGTTADHALTKTVKGFKGMATSRGALGNRADLNGDGRIDFTDFTMFSAVYGTTTPSSPPVSSNSNSNTNTNPPASSTGPSTGSSTGPSTATPTGLQPISPVPDSTVPHTSPVQ